MDLLQQYAQFLANGGLIPYILTGLEYLRRAISGDAPVTTGVAESYTPPFTGGQCCTSYNVVYNVKKAPSEGGFWVSGATQFVPGKILGAYRDGGAGSSTGIRFGYGAGCATIDVIPLFAGGSNAGLEIVSVTRADGLPDTCGNLPNPNPTPPIASDGVATSEPPDFAGAAVTGIVTGTALAADGTAAAGEGGQDDFAEAGALALTDIAGAIVKIAAGLSKLLTIIQAINELIDLLKKLFNKDNKSSFYYDFGNLRYDGFIRLQSEPPTDSITPLYLDLQVTSVKVGASRLFGEKSPNYYNREPIGYIHFVSPTFGVLSTHEIRFTRTSIPIPALAYGFFYNMGLDGVNRANATGFYLKQEE